MIKGIYGINIAVRNFEEAVKKYESVLNVKPQYFKDSDFAFPNLVGAQFFLGGVSLSVIGSKTEDTSIAKFVEHRGEGVFLVSVLVDDIENDVKEMSNKGLNFLTKIKKVPLGKVAFVHPKSFHGVQLEILQQEKND
ncbi:VOC family protein [bacterium]|nr:VOC family protein [bacterium]